MAWIPDGTPADAISPEVGAPIAEGGAMQGPGTHAVNATPVPVAEGVVYELTAPASGSAALHWTVEVTAGGETWVERDGYGIDGKQLATDTIAGAGTSVRVWRAPVDGVARFSVVIDGTATVTAATVAGRTGRVILTVPGDILAENIMASGGLLAGDPDGARVVIDADGVVAFDESGTETAQITGEGGEFIGGSFRTSDALPGQVVLSDTANLGTPGISIEPEDDTGYDVLPSIGPGPDHMRISGGVSTEGAISGAQFSAEGTSIFHNGPGANGTGSWALVNGEEARLAFREDRTNIFHESGMWVRPTSALLFTEDEDGLGHISSSSTSASLVASRRAQDDVGSDRASVYADLDNAALSVRKHGDRTRRLRVDEHGVWAEIETGPYTWQYDSYNLLETAQDSGWQTFDLEPGITGSVAVAWRNKGGVIYFRGFVTGDWTNGVWNVVASGLNPEWCPSATWVVAEAGSSTKGATMQMTADGRLRISPPVTSTTSYYLNAMTYPAG